jgi:MYXO-CTERM domain-containing protein
MRRMRRVHRSLLILLPLLILGWARSADAAFHIIKVTEVFAGNAASPNAQFVELQMYNVAGGQQFVSGHVVHFFDAAGNEIGTGAAFTANVANGANQSTILIATATAQTYFGITADLTMADGLISPLGGKVCWETYDCVAWGAWVGSTTGVGTPVNVSVLEGEALVRRLNISGGPTTLEAGDDTGDSANDFVLGFPTPRNNAGTTGIPQPGCGNAIVDPTEDCDDGNSTNGDGCSTSCGFEVEADASVDAPPVADAAPDAPPPVDASPADAAVDASGQDAAGEDATPSDAAASDGAPADAGRPDDAAPADAPPGDPDAAPPGSDASTGGGGDDGGCGCRAPSGGGGGSALLLGLAGLIAVRRRRR